MNLLPELWNLIFELLWQLRVDDWNKRSFGIYPGPHSRAPCPINRYWVFGYNYPSLNSFQLYQGSGIWQSISAEQREYRDKFQAVLIDILDPPI